MSDQASTKRDAILKALSPFEPLFPDATQYQIALAEVGTVSAGKSKTYKLQNGDSVRVLSTPPTYTAVPVPAKRKQDDGGNYEAQQVKERADRLIAHFSDKRLKIWGERYFYMDPTGVLQELEKGYRHLEHEAMAKFVGELVPKEAKETLQLASALMQINQPAQYVLDPRAVPVLTFADDPVAPCWHRLSFTREGSDILPVRFSEITSRIVNPLELDGFCEFLGSLLDLEADRSQYLYLHTEGGDGKSTLVKMLIATLKSAVYVTRGEAYMRQFGRSSVEGKRLVVLQEENSLGFLSSSAFKELTGDDVMEVERKGLDPYQIDVRCKVAVISNKAPRLVGGAADERRILPVTLSPLPTKRIDTQFPKELAAEGPAILAYCWGKYLKWKAAHPTGGFMGDEVTRKKVFDGSLRHDIQNFIDATFRESAGTNTSAAMVDVQLEQFARKNEFKRREAEQFFRDRFGAPIALEIDGKSLFGYVNVGMCNQM